MVTQVKEETEQRRQYQEQLLAAEIALKDQRERVAELRRQLPIGPKVATDYIFREGPPDLSKNDPSDFFDTALSELFTEGRDRLILIHFMFGAADERPCSMCNIWAEGYDAVAPHVGDKVNFVLVAKADIGKLRRWARERGWHKIRLLSSHDNSFNRDYGVEDEDGSQRPGVSVFSREADGSIHHFYATQASLGDGHHRGIDLYTPVWNLFDLLPEGREDWMPQHFYA